MAVKERRTKILLSLLLLGDVNFSSVKLDEKVQKIFDFTMNQKTRGTISGLIKEELIEKVSNQLNQPKSAESANTDITDLTVKTEYRLTEKGFYAICLEFPFFRYLKDRWDKKWKIGRAHV